MFKIVITSLTPVRVDMWNLHYFYVNTVIATLVATAKSECYLSILGKVKTYPRNQDQPNALFVSALIMILWLKFYFSASIKSRNLQVRNVRREFLYEVTPWHRVLEKLVGPCLVKKILAFCGTQRFIALLDI